MQSDDTLITNSLDKAEMLNRQFKSVFTNEPLSNLPDKVLSPHPTMPEISVTCQGIENLLNGLQTHKATGPDTISAKILRATSNIIALAQYFLPVLLQRYLSVLFETDCLNNAMHSL